MSNTIALWAISNEAPVNFRNILLIRFYEISKYLFLRLSLSCSDINDFAWTFTTRRSTQQQTFFNVKSVDYAAIGQQKFLFVSHATK